MKKYYLIDYRELPNERNSSEDINNLNDEEWIEISKEQNLDYTEEDFVSSFNFSGRADTRFCYLRIIEE